MFILQNTPHAELTLYDASIERLSFESPSAKLDMTLSMVEDSGGLHGTLEYSTELFDPSTIERFVEHFCTLLAGICQDPEQSIGLLPLLSKRERHMMVTEWNDTRLDFGNQPDLIRQFQTQAQCTPTSLAFRCIEQVLTYRELDERSNQLAHYLRSHGIGANTYIGLCMERSLDAVIAVLGIYKVGGYTFHSILAIRRSACSL